MESLSDRSIIQHAKTRRLAGFLWPSFIHLYWIKRMDEMYSWYHEWMKEVMNESLIWVGEWANVWISDEMNEWTDLTEWIIEQLNEWINEWANKQINGGMSELINCNEHVFCLIREIWGQLKIQKLLETKESWSGLWNPSLCRQGRNILYLINIYLSFFFYSTIETEIWRRISWPKNKNSIII